MWRTNAEQTDVRQLKTTTITDPATNAAVTTDILDTYSWVIITTTGASNAQTLQTPTNTDKIKRFSVVNNDTSTNAITVNWASLAAWEVRYFIWDGSAWNSEASGGSWDIVWPWSSTDNAVARYDSTTGKLLQNSSVLIDDSNNLTWVGNITSVAGGITISTATNGALTLDPGGSWKTTVNAGSGGVDITTDAGNSDITITPHWTWDVIISSASLITPALWTPASWNLANCTFPTLNQNTTGTASNVSWTPPLPDGTTATTQSASDNSTKLATTAYVDAAAWGGWWVSNIFSAYLSSSYSLTNTITVLPFSNEVIDTGANYNTTTYQYTAPSTWNYQIVSILYAFSLTSHDALVTQVFINTTVASSFIWTGHDRVTVTNSPILALTSWDTVEVRAYNLNGSRWTLSSGVSGSIFGAYKLD